MAWPDVVVDGVTVDHAGDHNDMVAVIIKLFGGSSTGPVGVIGGCTAFTKATDYTPIDLENSFGMVLDCGNAYTTYPTPGP